MVLTVLPSEQTIGVDKCSAPKLAPTRQVIVRLQEGAVLNCTDHKDDTKMADGKLNFSWLYVNPSNLVTNRRQSPATGHIRRCVCDVIG